MVHRNRSRARMILSSPFTLVIALVLLIFLAKAARNINIKALDSSDRLESARAELLELEAARDAAAAQVGRLSTDAGIKAEFREKYRAVEPGESVAVIIDPSPSLKTASTSGIGSEEAVASKHSWWIRLFTRD